MSCAIKKVKFRSRLRWTIKNIRLLFFRLRFPILKEYLDPGVYFITHPDHKHPGFVDILKAIIGTYYMAKENGLPFKIALLPDFHFETYLQPNTIDWRIKDMDIYSVPINTHFLNYYGVGKVPKLKKKYCYRVYNYIGWNILQRNNVSNWQQKWRELYCELFKPTLNFNTLINSFELIENQYIAVHTRFVNTFGVAEPDYPQQPLPQEEQKDVLNKCLGILHNIQNKYKLPVVVFSDSSLFIDFVKEHSFQTIGGVIGHVTYVKVPSVVEKMFVDLYMIGRAKLVYRINGYPLYESAFPMYSCLINNKDLIDIKLV